VNLPFGRNHPAYIKFVVSKSFAITSEVIAKLSKGMFLRMAMHPNPSFPGRLE
jgi:hypothetical protein